jgi:hypothetical protein
MFMVIINASMCQCKYLETIRLLFIKFLKSYYKMYSKIGKFGIILESF